MTDKREQPGKKPKVEKLELDRETVADLTEQEAENVEGGALAYKDERKPRNWETWEIMSCGCDRQIGT